MLCGVLDFCWIVLPGFGAIDLSVTWSPDWPQVLEAGWGLQFTVLVGAPFVVAAHDRGRLRRVSRSWRSRPRRSRSRASPRGRRVRSCGKIVVAI